MPFARKIKRLIDVSAAASGLTLGAPLLLGISALELYFHGWPPIFRQKRPGKHGQLFEILKFRTMSNARDSKGELLSDAERLTAFGKALRKTSLDELPELINVLRGEMSLVGPRPLLVEYLPRYSKAQMRRHDMRPGITGLAAVKGRNALSWEEKFAYDLEYIDNWSLRLDFEILLRTVLAVIKPAGISHAGNATMPKFMGSAEHQAEAVVNEMADALRRQAIN